MFKSGFLVIFIFFGMAVLAQSGTISGTLVFETNEPVTDVLVMIQGTQTSAVANEKGEFTFANIPYGKYVLETNSMDAQFAMQNVEVNSATISVRITLKKKQHEQLSEVVVTALTHKQKIENKGFAVNVIDTKTAALRNLQTNELLSRSAGVRIRQNGGLGSEVRYTINGLSGNAVRIFIDAIPISTYGSSFDLNSIPPAMIERIEVYKGVVPGYLSDDSLGGAINIVMKSSYRNNINVAASYGSFNTAQTNFSGQYRFDKSGLTVKASAFLNYSDNDYEVYGKNVYNILPNGQYDYVRAKRFNDQFRSLGSVIEVGFKDVKWADQFFIGFTTSDSYKEVQHGTFMTTPYKGRFLESDANLLNLNYNKKGIFVKGLDLNVQGIFGERHRTVNDTVKYNYNWFGEKSLDLNGNPILRPLGAQQGAPTITNINRKVASLRTGLSYSINENNTILINHLFSMLDRTDDDELKSVLERKFFGTRDLTKNILSLSYEFTAFENRLKTTLFGKYYQQNIDRMNPIVTNINGVQTRVEDIVSSSVNTDGYGVAFSYALTPQVSLLASAEKSVRLPDENEVFGDVGDNIAENPNIRPEISKNFNVGTRLGSFRYKKHEATFTVNGFVRNVTDRIGIPIQTSLNSNVQTLPYVNQGNTKSTGFDMELNYSFKKNLSVIINASKFDLTTKDITGNEFQLPNEPFFTANASVQYTLKNVLSKDAQLNLYYNFMFVDQFSYIRTLYSNTSGTDFFDVPQQFLNDFGVSYVFPSKKYIISFDAKNVFNEQVFDNLAVQKPGRAFYLKFNYVINNL
ncbi:TonB-dependent receptor [Flavobacterium tegetincola]|uniref:TonB-dependent receptor n=1 Tax=Flavobacterium tegetincola TaxID=150172 RepID=UPI00040FE639|nr:TonB-dependent receptor [Flavobacterium tegetincola]